MLWKQYYIVGERNNFSNQLSLIYLQTFEYTLIELAVRYEIVWPQVEPRDNIKAYRLGKTDYS